MIHGETTRDNITLGIPHPAEHRLPPKDTEGGILSYSRRVLVAGISILVGTYLATLAVALITDNNSALNHPIGRLFAVIGFNTLHSLGAALILIAGLERITRPMRALVRAGTAQARENVRISTVTQRAADTSNRLAGETIVKLAAIEHRLAAVETVIAKVPEFADGVSMGARTTAIALGYEQP